MNKNHIFEYEQPVSTPAESAIYRRHIQLTDKSRIVPFAGYLMPLWYSSISAEHSAVRSTAGLFDCTHMGVLGFASNNAQTFLNQISTNQLIDMPNGSAKYSYILDGPGNILDDIIIYKRADNDFMVVVNAANEMKIKAWLKLLKKDEDFTSMQVDISDLKNPGNAEAKVDIALQGPASVETLEKITDADIKAMKPFTFIETTINNTKVIISATGYTGSKTGFEIFAHPSQAVEIWDTILEAGKPSGVVPCGLGSRDSLRIESGLPLYGHELAGEFNISPFEAGYGWAVKLDKETFIGKEAMAEKLENLSQKVARIKLPGQKGIRPVRGNDAILDSAGSCIGYVLSCAAAGQNQTALALIDKSFTNPDTSIKLYYLARSRSQLQKGKKDAVKIGETLTADIDGKVISRFEKF